MSKKYVCQECRGRGTWTEHIESGYCYKLQCTCCNGTGKIDAKTRGLWLAYQRQQKRIRETLQKETEQDAIQPNPLTGDL